MLLFLAQVLVLTVPVAFFGAFRAKKLGGNKWDQLQFAVGFWLCAVSVTVVAWLIWVNVIS